MDVGNDSYDFVRFSFVTDSTRESCELYAKEWRYDCPYCQG